MMLLRVLGVAIAGMAVGGVLTMYKADGGYKSKAIGGYMFYAVIFVLGLSLALFPNL